MLVLEDAVRKMTSLPAQVLGLKDRGLLREGYRADVVLFDPDRVANMATYDIPSSIQRALTMFWSTARWSLTMVIIPAPGPAGLCTGRENGTYENVRPDFRTQITRLHISGGRQQNHVAIRPPRNRRHATQ